MNTTEQKTEIDFDEATHTYRFGGKVVPSVTQILRGAGAVDETWYRDPWYADRGKKIHLACHLLARGELDWASVDAAILPYVYAFQAFMQQPGVLIISTERRVYNSTWLYAGTIDLVAEINGRTSVIDIKSGAAPVWAGLQTAGYAMAYRDAGDSAPRYALELRDKGIFRLMPLTDHNDYEAFFACCKVYAWRLANGLTQEGAK